LELPETLEEITPEFLSSVLPGTKVESCQVTRIGEGVGFTGEIARVVPHYREKPEETPISLIAKLPTRDRSFRQKIWHVYEAEFHFYDKVAPSVYLKVPNCYYCSRNVEDHRGILLLEDFGYGRAGDQLTGCSISDARAAVSSLAAMHGSHWIGPRAPSEPDEATLSRTQRRRELFPTWWDQFKDKYSDIAPDIALAIGDVITPQVEHVQTRLASVPVSFTHGDFRLDNLFFFHDEIGVVDWQKYGEGSVVWDVGRFIVSSLEPDSPREAALELLSIYQAELNRRGVANYSLDSLIADFRFSLLEMWLFVVRIAVLLELPNERSRAVMRREIRQIGQALAEHEAVEVARSM